jgi:hypothetical protein
MNIFLIHPVHQQTNGFGHQQCVGRFHRYDNIGKIFVQSDAQVLHARLYHPFGGIAKASHDPVRQRPVIDAYTHCRTMFFTDL